MGQLFEYPCKWSHSLFVETVDAMSEYVDRHFLYILDCLNHQASADVPHHFGSLYDKFLKKPMVHLLQVPHALRLILQYAANDSKVVRNMLVLILVSQHNRMEIEHCKLEALLILEAAYVLSQSDKVIIKDD